MSQFDALSQIIAKDNSQTANANQQITADQSIDITKIMKTFEKF